MYWSLPWLQNSHAWLGACLQRVVTTTPISWATPHKIHDRPDLNAHNSLPWFARRKDEWRNGSTDTSEAWFDAMALLEAGELLRTEVGGYP
jgi:hypothetical protein